jgi:hypothetical protein
MKKAGCLGERNVGQILALLCHCYGWLLCLPCLPRLPRLPSAHQVTFQMLLQYGTVQYLAL